MHNLTNIRQRICDLELADEATVVNALISSSNISSTQRRAFSKRATILVKSIRRDDRPGLMEVFLTEYGLSTNEGVALMCMAEALLRVPDADTIDNLIEDKIAPSSWDAHLGNSSSSLVNASTWALMLTGKVLAPQKGAAITKILRNAVKRLGKPVIRVAVKRAMKEMANQFVLGETIGAARKRGVAQQKKGFTYSYDMLGEAALTAKDADGFYQAYKDMIKQLNERTASNDVRDRPGISIKLSALHPRYEVSQKDRVLSELVQRTLSLTLLAKNANIGLNIDAEEADRLDLYLDVIEAVLSNNQLENWDGFGVVVQAYSKRALAVLDWLYALSENLDRKIMVRLVKGAYWDTEIKKAQVDGLKGYPVFTRKAATDISYICCAKKLLGQSGRLYAQFATHNAHSVAAILELSSNLDALEFQRLHGMGSVLHRQVMESEATRCRIYAPVGVHSDLLAYLVRRLLENGANSSFVNQIVDETFAPEIVGADPFETLENQVRERLNHIDLPKDLYGDARQNSKGWDIHSQSDLAEIEAARLAFKNKQWTVRSILAKPCVGDKEEKIFSPANPVDCTGSVIEASAKDVEAALISATHWGYSNVDERQEILNKTAALYEENFGEIFALLTREAGKTTRDAIAEIREAVDFLRYYGHQAKFLEENKDPDRNENKERSPLGVVTCISPWNFPLAIFTGQIAAALAAGNGVLAKPAEITPIIASLAVKLLHKAGVPKTVLQLVLGQGRTIGAQLVSAPKIDGVCFTGSTITAQIINRSMAETVNPYAPLIAETGGLNAMLVDSTALPEQAVKDIIDSAFQSAGQRCSALRLLYLQSDVAHIFMEMLLGAMSEQKIGDPWDFSTDIGSIINESARVNISNYIETARGEGRLIKQLPCPQEGNFIGPAVISVSGIGDMQQEVFGPVLHVATYEAHEIGKIVEDINASQYGLTFGLHTRIDQRVEFLTTRLNVGNIYVNRNQIGAVVGSQPFGGEGLSGTGPKAGGPHYVKHFTKQAFEYSEVKDKGTPLSIEMVQALLSKISKATRKPLNSLELPGPTGESNRLSLYPRGTILCLGPNLKDAKRQAKIAQENGCKAVIICAGASGEHALDGSCDFDYLTKLLEFEAVAYFGQADMARNIRVALSKREGPLLPLIGGQDMVDRCTLERHICINTTASGGNVALLASL
ncbi:MAG: bifunctional proline dehydrogenase/L-glutamate gamma-semialdehyde dehydrogenase PutA [Robiginitomaculum sp.]